MSGITLRMSLGIILMIGGVAIGIVSHTGFNSVEVNPEIESLVCVVIAWFTFVKGCDLLSSAAMEMDK